MNKNDSIFEKIIFVFKRHTILLFCFLFCLDISCFFSMRKLIFEFKKKGYLSIHILKLFSRNLVIFNFKNFNFKDFGF